jgi:hypothetical protein
VSRVEDDEQDLTRKQRREQARAQRKEIEEAQAASAARRQRITRVWGPLVAVIVVAAVAVAVSSSGSSHKATPVTSSGAEAGLLTTPAPWTPQYAQLQSRVQAFKLPTQSDVGYHVHVALRIYIEGKQLPLASQIGIDASESFLAPLHTHDSSGVVHIESSERYPFTLGQFFTIWGVKFTGTQLGGYVPGNGKVLSVYVNGNPVANPVGYVMNAHDDIVVGYGKPGSFPTSFHYNWAGSGL